MGLKEYEVIVENLFSEKKDFKIKNSQTSLFGLCIMLAAVIFEGKTNKFPLTYSFQKGPKRRYIWTHTFRGREQFNSSFYFQILGIVLINML